jgi:hypothetical protein
MEDIKGQPRRFSPPWDIEDNGACFIVRGFQLWCYSRTTKLLAI